MFPFRRRLEGGRSAMHCAFNLIMESHGRKMRGNAGGDVHENDAHKWSRQPPVRYEIFHNKIIRTVSTFHYISQETTVDGLCRSFRRINTKYFPKPWSTNKKVKGISDIVWKVFNKRYYVGKITRVDLKGSDLDMRVKYIKVSLRHKNYFAFCIQKEGSEEFTSWRLFAAMKYEYKDPNTITPARMAQQDIIEKIRNGEIMTITKYGDPKKKYTREEALEILEG